MKKSIVTFMLIFVAMFCGCNSESQQNADTPNTEIVEESNMANGNYKATEEYIKPLGRTYFDGELLWCAYSGSGVEFTFTGKKCEFILNGDSVSANPTNVDNHARVAFYVDGERVVDEMMNAKEKTLTVFESDEVKTVTIKMVKLSETAMSTVAIKEIVTDGEIAPTPAKDLYIEIVGDSITCGYGVDDPVKENHFKTTTEDVTKSYSYKTVSALDADYSMVSISGYGIISGYTDNGQIKPTQTIPPYYDKLGFSYGDFGSVKPNALDWDFSKRQPDLIVINLGTNDASYCGSDAERCEVYQKAYVEFLKKIRANNPDAKILCTLGIMGDSLYPYVEKAAADYTAETGDANISTMKFDVQLPEDGYSADWHPSLTTHDKATEKLVAEIKKLLNI